MKTLQVGVMLLVSAFVFAMPAAGQRGVGESAGVAQRAQKPAIGSFSGTIKDIKTGSCERTTGRSALGVHLVVEAGRVNSRV